MGCSNIRLRIEMNTVESANNAVEIIKNFATENTSVYLSLSADRFTNDVRVTDNTRESADHNPFQHHYQIIGNSV